MSKVSERRKRLRATERVPRICCMVNCERVALHAKKTAGFWISWCEQHQRRPAPLSLNKALDCL